MNETSNELTPTERAEQLLWRATFDPAQYVKRELHTDGEPDELPVWQAKASLAALLSDPALLFDLTVEAGGMKHVGAVRSSRRTFEPNPPGLHYAGPVYRRV